MAAQLRVIIAASLISCLSHHALALVPRPERFAAVGGLGKVEMAAAAPLFSKSEVLNLVIEAPFKKLFEQRSQGMEIAKEAEVDGSLLIAGKKIKTEIKMRGHSTVMNCPFPKLKLKLDKADGKGTEFEGVKKLDLGTHCAGPETSADDMMYAPMVFNHREALLYKWAEMLEIPTYGVRMANITYRDTSDPSAVSEITHQAFFLEHLDSFLKRAGATEIRKVEDAPTSAGEEDEPVKYLFKGIEDHPQIDKAKLAEIALFEAFIVNLDWDIGPQTLWNMKMIELPAGAWLVVPMDFNLTKFASAAADEIAMGDLFRQDLFSLADRATQLGFVEKLESKKTDIMHSVDLLSADPAGREKFKTHLEAHFKFVSELKAKLKAELKN